MKPKVYWVFDELIVCGGVLVPLAYNRELNRLGHESYIVGKRNPELESEYGFTPINISDIKAHPLNIIIAVWWKQMPFLANLTGRKIQFVQGNDVDTYPPELAVECYKARTDKRWETMAVSRYALNWTGREGEIIPNFVEERFYPKEVYKDIDVLIEGNLEENKGIEEALAITEGMNRAWLGRTTKTIPNCKMFTNPKREEIPDIFRRSKITLKCSRSEGFGLPHLEAMACGSCLVTYASGGNDFCIDRENCRVVDKGTARGCIERMTRERREQLINGGLETASKYRLPNSMAKLLNFLKL